MEVRPEFWCAVIPGSHQHTEGATQSCSPATLSDSCARDDELERSQLKMIRLTNKP
jgi:hypothetical protein